MLTETWTTCLFQILIANLSSSAVQKEPTQGPIQSDRPRLSALSNRLYFNHHWCSSFGWILWSYCEFFLKADLFFILCLCAVMLILLNKTLLHVSELRPDGACADHRHHRFPAWDLPLTDSLLCIKGLSGVLLRRHPRL